MRKITYYQGKEITEKVLNEINKIARERYDERTLEQREEGMSPLTNGYLWNNTSRQEENVILGEDWFITYADKKNEIEILEWVSLEKVSNKLEQTIEMFTEIKKILLLSKDRKISAYMKHLTSYPFYEKLLEKGYFEEIHNYPQIEHGIIEGSKEDIQEIVKKYGSLYEYLKSHNKEYQHLEQCIYHDTTFRITNKFIKRYQKTK